MENEELNTNEVQEQPTDNVLEEVKQPESKPISFEDAVKKYKNDKASAEEIELVEKTVKDARAVAKTRLKDDKHLSFGRRIKRFFVRLAILLVLVALILGVSYIKLNKVANDNAKIAKTGAIVLVDEFMFDLGYNADQYKISENKKQLVTTIPFDRSYLLYVFDVVCNDGKNYKIYVDTYTEYVEYTIY